MKIRSRIAGLAAVLVAAFVIAGLAWAAGGNDVPMVKTKDGVGNYLTDGKGMTLYYFKKDTKDTSACAGPCVEKWPVYNGGAVKAPAGTDPSEFGSITRPDGAVQTTLRGWPLYYFAGDKKPGDTNGQGKMDVWYVINPINLKPCI